LNVSKEIDTSLLSCNVPSLILQPIVENAIEHGIAQLQQGDLIIRAYKLKTELVLEVENDGILTDQDRQTIDELLSGDSSNSSVGIRNVNQRLRIMYGAGSGLAIEQLRPGRILAKIRIPM
jgi:two-component system sensor histidine kinase YesM